MTDTRTLVIAYDVTGFTDAQIADLTAEAWAQGESNGDATAIAEGTAHPDVASTIDLVVGLPIVDVLAEFAEDAITLIVADATADEPTPSED